MPMIVELSDIEVSDPWKLEAHCSLIKKKIKYSGRKTGRFFQAQNLIWHKPTVCGSHRYKAHLHRVGETELVLGHTACCFG